MKCIEWNGSEVIILDQTKLPTYPCARSDCY